jgi:CheY-like chemotaxis protein
MLGHELRNPIGTIANAISALTLVNKDDQQGAPMREVIQRQVIHLSTLVDDLLDASRLITGKIVLRRQPMNLTAAVQRCTQVLAMHRTLLQTSVQAEEDVWIDGDETRIEQVINNLISNAIKYTPEGGEVVVRLAHADGRAALSVADTGIGIPQQLLPHVFDLFVQGPTQGLERARGGLGIGLTVVKRLVELHDGTVEVSSEGAGRGSTFTVCLPTIQPASVKTQPEGSFTCDASVVSPKRILIIEDQADQREALRLALSLRGHVVYAAADGRSGVALVEGERPDVVIVDIGLPHMDGYEVARRIRTLNYGAAVRLVALTGYGQPEDRARAQEAGFDLHLVKPVDNQRLDQVLGNQ